MRILDLLTQALRTERAVRHPAPGVVAYFWDGAAPAGHPVKDISLTGAYLYAKERWCEGTVIELTLQEITIPDRYTCANKPLSVNCKVVRHGPDGIAVTFMLPTQNDRKALKQFMNRTVLNAGPAHPAGANGTSQRGQALIEYAFMVPFLLLLIVNCINFGAFIYDWIEVANAARAGAQYAILGGASAGALTPATGAQIKTVILADMASVPGTPTVSVCTNNSASGTAVITTLTGSCSGSGSLAVPADPEPASYVLATVDVTYTYKPMTGALSFPKLGIYVTIPPTSIHRRAVMRMIQ